jgi:hypothetical protein
MLLQEVIGRLETKVTALAGRIRTAEDYAGLLQMSGMTSATGGAYVMPAGLRGGKVLDATGVFAQDLDRVIAVVIIVPAPNPGFSLQASTIDAQIRDVIDALCGWVPADVIGPFQLVRGAMINLGEGLLAFQIDFSVPDQLRIIP